MEIYRLSSKGNWNLCVYHFKGETYYCTPPYNIPIKVPYRKSNSGVLVLILVVNIMHNVLTEKK